MSRIDFETIAMSLGGTVRFEGAEYDSPVSFFIGRNLPGEGASKHRHPYAETFVILEGEIEFIIDGELSLVGPGSITVAPAMAWHEFKNRSDRRCLTVNIHPVPEIIQENWVDR